MSGDVLTYSPEHGDLDGGFDLIEAYEVPVVRAFMSEIQNSSSVSDDVRARAELVLSGEMNKRIQIARASGAIPVNGAEPVF